MTIIGLALISLRIHRTFHFGMDRDSHAPTNHNNQKSSLEHTLNLKSESPCRKIKSHITFSKGN